jgi:hypothetical protein
MWKNLLTLLISLSLCAAVLWWLAPLLIPQNDSSLPGYDQLVNYDPARPGGHLKPDINMLVRGERRGQGVPWITNSQGFRNRQEITPEPAGDVLRILFYGDSFVDGMRTGQDNTMGAVLERELALRLGRKVELLISGHNNPANAWYHWQTHGRHFHPHFVILGLTMGNDLTSHNFGAGVLPVVESMDYLVRTEPGTLMAGPGNGQVMIPEDGFLPEDQWSRWQISVAELNQSLARRFFFLAHRTPPALGPRPGAPGQAMAAGFFVSLGLYYRGTIPYIETVWRDFETLLPGFVAQIRYFGARPLLVKFPTRIEALPGDWARFSDALQLDRSQFDLRAPSRRVAALCEHNALPCLDTAAALEQGQKEDEVFRPLGDMHLSDHGQAVTAHAIADFMEALMPPEPVPVPAENWLEDYRSQVLEWNRQALMQDAPWLNPETGAAKLNLTDHRHALKSLLTQGWLSDDGRGAFWGGQGVASIRIPVARSGVNYQVRLLAKPFLAEANNFRQRVVFSIGGDKIGEQLVDQDDFTQIEIMLPADRLDQPWTRIAVEFPDALVPAEIGVSSDQRRLGIAVIGLDIEPGELKQPGQQSQTDTE